LVLETSLLQQQRNLKEVSYDRKLCLPVLHLNVELRASLPMNLSLLTSVRISLTNSGDEPVNLGLFSQCPNLKTLWLLFYRGVRIGLAGLNTLRFTNMELLPRTIQSFHLKSSQEDTIIIHQQSILTRAQILWIIENLQDLESIWLQLVIEEEPLPDLVGENPNEEDNENQGEVEENAPELEEWWRIPNQPNAGGQGEEQANIDVETFRRLISMPKLRDMKFDMLLENQLEADIAIGLDGQPWVLPVHPATPEDIQEYIEVCENDARITFTPNQVLFFPIRFIEISLARN